LREIVEINWIFNKKRKISKKSWNCWTKFRSSNKWTTS